jgi:DNA replication and repair protein RecF
MYLQKIFLVNFKNYAQAELLLSPKFNCFVGDNGEGKTNLLDAIHYLSFCKSFLNPIDSQNILHDAPFFVIQGEFQKEEKTEHIYCGMKKNEKKQFKRNQKEYQRLADHIGNFPLVMISPSDSELITEGSEFRRRFIDSVISQFDKNYLESLINYNKALAQRNTLLKQFADSGKFEQSFLELWDAQLIVHGKIIYSTRREFINRFVPYFSEFYHLISGKKEVIDLHYESQLNDLSFDDLLKKSVERDRAVMYTTTGIHKDDLIFSISGNALKKQASQGQQKTFLIAMKLAQFEFLKQVKQIMPLLLLDDIFDKLDESRVGRLMKLIIDKDFGQIFITDTHEERISNILNNLDVCYKTFRIDNGRVFTKSPEPAIINKHEEEIR